MQVLNKKPMVSINDCVDVDDIESIQLEHIEVDVADHH